MTTATKRMTLDEFLALPETEPPSEFACGRVIPKPMPTLAHSILTSQMIRLLGNYVIPRKLGAVGDNTRFRQDDEQRAYLPDVTFVLKESLPPERSKWFRGALTTRPDIAIEVVSPDDRPGRLATKLAFYLRNGVPLTWHIDPEERTLTAFRPGQPETVHQAPEVIDAAPLLPDFKLDLAEYFAVLDD
jgi:Uma2 family endonuclease